MKIKIFSASNNTIVEESVNEFIKDKEVIDIKYTPSFVVNGYNDDGIPVSGAFIDRVMVMYEELKKKGE